VAELLNVYWTFAQEYFAVEAGKSDGELKGIKLALKAVKALYADAEVMDFGPLALRAVRDEMVKSGWSRKYCNAQVNRIRRVFKWGVERELVQAETWHALQAVSALKAGKTEARENVPVSIVDDCHVDIVLPWLSRQVRAMVQLQRINGARPSEILSMRGIDLNTFDPRLWEYRPADHKTNKGHERIIYLNAAAQAELKPFLKTDVSAFIFSPAEAEAERRAEQHEKRKTPLSCGNVPGSNRSRKPRRPAGERYDEDSYRRAITRACDFVNELVPYTLGEVERWTPYRIRHNAGTAIRAKHGVEAAQVIL
jgi:integrase